MKRHRALNVQPLWTAAICVALFGAFGCGGPIDESDADTSTAVSGLEPAIWTALPSVNAGTGPSMVAAGSTLHLVTVSTGGTLQYATTQELPDGWSAYSSVGRPSGVYFDSATAPVLLADGTKLYAFARGLDNNLYRATKNGTSAWTTWTAMTNHGRVRGRISAAFSRRTIFINGEPGSSVLVTHVAYAAPSTTVEYLRLEGTTQIATSTFNSAIDAVVQGNGSEVWIAVHANAAVTFHRAVASSGSWTWSQVASRGAPFGRVYDISDLRYFAGAFHLVYSAKTVFFPDFNTSYRLIHTRFIPGETDDNFSRTLTTFTPSQDPDAAGDTAAGRLFPEATLAVYRNKLVAAYRMHTGSIRYARWDNADPAAPWLGNLNVAGGYSRRRPALAPFNGRALLENDDYANDNYSDDLFSGSIGYSLSTIHVVDFSRAIFKQDVAAQFNIYSSNSDSLPESCVTQSSPSAPTLEDIADYDKPVLSEIGYNLWMLPHWFVNGLYREVAQDFCYDQNEDWIDSGRAPAPCSTVKMPIVIKTDDDIGVCQAAWSGRNNSAIRVWEELGHYAAEGLAIASAGYEGPTQEHADRTGIPLSQLLTASELFSEGIWLCSGTMRCTGFTGHANNYDVGSAQHSFMYVVYYYLNDGALLRSFIQQDLYNGSDLLQRKYNWVRDNIFKGIEFGPGGAPFAPL